MLYLVGTPIGNMQDLSPRAVEVLSTVDLVACEDTRRTGLLLSHFGISAKLMSYHEHNKASAGSKIIARLKEGQQVALVSDAGMPSISDPGEDLVKLCIEEGIDPEASGSGEGNNFFKSPEEQVEIKTKLAAQAIKPAVPAPKPVKPVSAPAKEEKPANEPAKAPAEPAPKVEEPKKAPAKAPEATIPEPGCDAGFSPTGALAKTLKDRYANWQEFTGKGLVAKEVFEKMASDYRKIADMPSAIAFNTKYPLQK